jgi:hypothetical protein
VVVEHDLFPAASDAVGHAVEALRVRLAGQEEPLDPLAVLGDCADRGEEVAVSQVPLDDLGGVDALVKDAEARPPEDLVRPQPLQLRKELTGLT